jgi:peptide deformylase
VDEALRAIGERLRAAADAAGAYGLAAVHIGAVAPVAVISTAADPDKRNYLVLFNPEILSLDGDAVEAPEGSVSMPGLQAPVSRPPRARIAYDDETGTRHDSDLEGLPARIAQHEIDQVNGIFFLERLSRLKRDMAIKRWKKSQPA